MVKDKIKWLETFKNHCLSLIQNISIRKIFCLLNKHNKFCRKQKLATKEIYVLFQIEWIVKVTSYIKWCLNS